MNFTYRPISTWPGQLTAERTPSRFKASFDDTLERLTYELGWLEATNVVIELALTEGDLRKDGHMRQNAKVQHPGVIVSFGSIYGPLRYASDAFETPNARTPGWHHNLRAIALGLEALRTVDRYGITKRGEQYDGWKAIGTGREKPMTRQEALTYLADAAGVRGLAHKADLDRAYRIAARRLHPDAGGNPAGFARLVAAKAVLDGSE